MSKHKPYPVICQGICTSQLDDYCGMHMSNQTCIACNAIWTTAHVENEIFKRNKLVKVLEWYADKKNWQLGVSIFMGSAHPHHEPIKTDKGERARAILAQYATPEPPEEVTP